MSHPTRHVANALLHKAREQGLGLTHLKIQKLLFFMQAWGLALHDWAVTDELPEAWAYGPVFPGLYHELKHYGSQPIVGYLTEPDPATGNLITLAPNPADTRFWGLLNQVWERYGNLTAGQLSTLSHADGGPWQIARAQGRRNMVAPEIKHYYRSQLNNAGQ